MKNINGYRYVGTIIFLLLAAYSVYDTSLVFAREGGINLVSLGIFTLGIGVTCFFLSIPASIIFWEAKQIFLNPFWMMWVYCLGCFLYALGMFLGSGKYPASPEWGIWLLLISAFFGATAYKGGFTRRTPVKTSEAQTEPPLDTAT